MKEKKSKNLKQLHWPLFFRDLMRNIWLVILAGLIAVMSVFCYNGLLWSPEYTSTVTFAVSPRTNGSYVGFYTSLSTASEMAEVFKEVFSSDVLKRMVKDDVGQPGLNVQVKSTLEDGTNILTVSAKADNPLLAHKIMESVLHNYGKVSEYMFGNVVLDTIKSPYIPTEPSNTLNLPMLCSFAAVLAMSGMIAGIYLLFTNRTTLKTLAGSKYYMGEAPIGVLTREKNAEPGRRQKVKGLLIWKTAVSFRYTESMLQIAHKLRHRMDHDGKKTLLITSVAENEGKSTLAANLAIALSRHGARVALVDLDLRRPALHKLFAEMDVCQDLTKALDRGFRDPHRPLVVYTQHGTEKNPGSLLHDPRLESFLEQMRQTMDYVILDSAPYAAVADTGMLLKYADCCLMSVRQDWVPAQILRDVSQELDQGKADYIGYVLNYYLDNGSLQTFDKGYKKYASYPQGNQFSPK